MKKLIVLLFLMSGQAWGQATPVAGQDKPSDSSGITVGLQTGMAVTQFEGEPIGLDESKLVPPILTGKFEWTPNLRAKFQPDLRGAVSVLSGGGIYFYAQAGGWFDFPKFHLFFGGEVLTTLAGGDYDETIVDHYGLGAYIKAGVPLGFLYPSLEIRYREITEAEVTNRESLTTYSDHEGDTIIRPALDVDLSFVKLWGALTFYRVGNTAIASKDFAIGIEESMFTIFSVGVGIPAFGGEVWVKLNRLEGVNDDVAHYYQVPQVYPDFLLAKESAFLEMRWNF